MADELIALFGKITTSDHDQLVEQFSKILHVENNIATFFLEASSWNVETAVHNYLASVGAGNRHAIRTPSTPPQARFTGDLSLLENTKFAPGQRLPLRLSFRNTGTEPWPEDTSLSFVDGHMLNGPQSILVSAGPGGEAIVMLSLVAPVDAGTYMGSWRLACNAGYFGDALYVIVNVDKNAPPIEIPGSHHQHLPQTIEQHEMQMDTQPMATQQPETFFQDQGQLSNSNAQPGMSHAGLFSGQHHFQQQQQDQIGGEFTSNTFYQHANLFGNTDTNTSQHQQQQNTEQQDDEIVDL